MIIISNYMYSRSRVDRLAQCYLPMIAEHGFGLYDNDPQEGANDEDVLLSVRRAL